MATLDLLDFGIELLVIEVTEVGSLHYFHRWIYVRLRARDTVELEGLEPDLAQVHLVDNGLVLVPCQVELISAFGAFLYLEVQLPSLNLEHLAKD